jgi:hypothetical protein
MRSTSRGVTAGQWLVAATALFGAVVAEAQPRSTAPSGDVFSSTNCQTVYQQTAAQINAQHSRDWPACGGASACIRAANAKKADALKKANQDLRLCQASGGVAPPPTATDAPPSGPRPLDTIVLPPPRDRQPVEIPPPNTDVGPPPSPGKRRSPPFEPAVRPSVPSTPPPTVVTPSPPQRQGTGSTQRNVPPWNNVTGGGAPRTWKHNVVYDRQTWSIYTDETGQPWGFRPDFVDDGTRYVLDPATVYDSQRGSSDVYKAVTYRATDSNGVFVPGGLAVNQNGQRLQRRPPTTR